MKTDRILLFLTFLGIFTMGSWIASCTHDAKIGDLPEICFDAEILPIFLNSCAITSCHDGQGESDLTFTTYADIRANVVPGKPNTSKVYKAIIATFGENKMPPDQPLSQNNRTLIRLWIEQGAEWTVCPQIK
jgi:hypothetical protein